MSSCSSVCYASPRPLRDRPKPSSMPSLSTSSLVKTGISPTPRSILKTGSYACRRLMTKEEDTRRKPIRRNVTFSGIEEQGDRWDSCECVRQQQQHITRDDKHIRKPRRSSALVFPTIKVDGKNATWSSSPKSKRVPRILGSNSLKAPPALPGRKASNEINDSVENVETTRTIKGSSPPSLPGRKASQTGQPAQCITNRLDIKNWYVRNVLGSFSKHRFLFTSH